MSGFFGGKKTSTFNIGETHPCKNSSVARESMHPMTIGAMDVIHGECNIP
jgi:hypothetical protein